MSYDKSANIFFIFRQKMAEILIHDLHNLAGEAIKTMTHSRSYQIISERQVSYTRHWTLETRQIVLIEVDIYQIL